MKQPPTPGGSIYAPDDDDNTTTIGDMQLDHETVRVKRMVVEWYRARVRLMAEERGWRLGVCTCRRRVLWVPNVEGRLACYSVDLVPHLCAGPRGGRRAT